jgi:hypothetical protein
MKPGAGKSVKAARNSKEKPHVSQQQANVGHPPITMNWLISPRANLEIAANLSKLDLSRFR